VIILDDISCHWTTISIENLTIEIAGGQIQALLCADSGFFNLLMRLFSGSLALEGGVITIDGLRGGVMPAEANVACLERIVDAGDFDADVQVDHWLSFIRNLLQVPEERLLEMLIKFSFPREWRRKRLKDLETEQFRLLYAALQCARPCRNWIIHDFCRGVEKALERKINRIWMQKRDQGEALLYLTNDLFYASEIADRIGFIKHGQLVFTLPAEELKEMDFQKLHRQFLG